MESLKPHVRELRSLKEEVEKIRMESNHMQTHSVDASA